MASGTAPKHWCEAQTESREGITEAGEKRREVSAVRAASAVRAVGERRRRQVLGPSGPRALGASPVESHLRLRLVAAYAYSTAAYAYA